MPLFREKLAERKIGTRVESPKTNISFFREPLKSKVSSSIVDKVKAKFPKIKPVNFKVKLSQEKGTGEFGGGLEFFRPDEPKNPFPGVATVEVFNPKLQGESLEKAVLGDILHFLPSVNKDFSQRKQNFIRSLTPQQIEFAQQRYAQDVQQRGEKRPFEQWFDMVWSDALIRGFIAPEKGGEFETKRNQIYTPEQISILEEMKDFLSKPDTEIPLKKRVSGMKVK